MDRNSKVLRRAQVNKDELYHIGEHLDSFSDLDPNQQSAVRFFMKAMKDNEEGYGK